MEDGKIVELFWQRNEDAIVETGKKYATLIRSVASGILSAAQDVEEIENDVYVRIWNAVPPERPERLSAYLCKIARRLSIDRYRKQSAEKRGASEYAASLSELEDCITGSENPAEEVQAKELAKTIDLFLAAVSPRKRSVFVSRYFYCKGIREIADEYGISENNVKVILSRIRTELKAFLLKEGY